MGVRVDFLQQQTTELPDVKHMYKCGGRRQDDTLQQQTTAMSAVNHSFMWGWCQLRLYATSQCIERQVTYEMVCFTISVIPVSNQLYLQVDTGCYSVLLVTACERSVANAIRLNSRAILIRYVPSL